GKVFDLIFIDPPYLMDLIPEAIQIIDDNNMLQEDGVIVSKIDVTEEIFEGTENIKLFRTKKYGNTIVNLYRVEK
ncbi:MAG: RsmD family RNA methyltransferase, partial [Sarcina sp.]